jgi:hypothetical protein
VGFLAVVFHGFVRDGGDHVSTSFKRAQALSKELRRPEIIRIEKANKRQTANLGKPGVACCSYASICLTNYFPIK